MDRMQTNFRLRRQRMWQRLLGFGNVIVFSSNDSSANMVLIGIGDPVKIKEQIRQESRAARRREGVKTAEFIPS